MSSTIAYQGVKALLVAALAPLRVLDSEEVDDGLPQGQQPFVVLVEANGYERLASIGSPTGACIREEGDFTVHIFTLARDGFAPARAIADQLRDALRYRAIPNGRVEDVSPALPLGAFDGLWNETQVDVSYRLDLIRNVA